MKYTVREKEQPLNTLYEGSDFREARVASVWTVRNGYKVEAEVYDENNRLVDWSAAGCAIEALLDDVMEPDRQDMTVISSWTESTYIIDWTWRCYHNRAEFPADGYLAQAVKAYCFDLIVMTRNL